MLNNIFEEAGLKFSEFTPSLPAGMQALSPFNKLKATLSEVKMVAGFSRLAYVILYIFRHALG